MIVGFTGTRRGMTENQKSLVRDKLIVLKATEVHHGDCVGADTELNAIAKELNIRTVAHPPTADKYRAFCKTNETRAPKPYLARNRDIVAACKYLIVAPHGYKELLRGSGTWATMRIARRSHTAHGIVYPGVSR